VSYLVILEDSAKRELRHASAGARPALLEKLARLADNPRPAGVRKLQGGNHQGWRIRVGKYRILYTIQDTSQEVRVYKIALREHAYD
jgi:mRNA interferase RelE/StbE